MRYLILGLLLGGLLLNAGCKKKVVVDESQIMRDKFATITVGMSYDDVAKVMGSPGAQVAAPTGAAQASAASAGMTTYDWTAGGTTFRCYFKDSKLLGSTEIKVAPSAPAGK